MKKNYTSWEDYGDKQELRRNKRDMLILFTLLSGFTLFVLVRSLFF